MDDEEKVLIWQKYSTNYGSSGGKSEIEEDVYTPAYSSVNASDPREVRDNVNFSSLTTRVVTPVFDDRLLAPRPKVTQEVEVQTKLFKRRWYILVIFSLYSASENMVWNTWGPISVSSEDAFGWTDGTITLLTDWGPISYIVGAIFFSWLIGAKGLRLAVVSSMFLIAAGCGIRCISSEPPLATWINNIGAALNGLAGPVAMFGPPVISTTWFGPHERTTATALSVVISAMGIAVTFLMGPYLVPDRLNPNCTRNSSFGDDFGGSISEECAKYFNQSGVRIQAERKDIMFMLYIECGWSVLILLLLLIYFPSKPPLPPSVSASHKREDFLLGLKSLLRRRQFWLITFVYGLAFGVCDCWSGVVDVIVKPYGVTEKQAGWMGFYGIFAQVAVSLIIARFADKFSRHFKLFTMGLYTISTLGFVLFSLICVGVLPFSIVFLYTCYIVATMCLNGALPVIFELAGEMTYPVAEATTNSVLTLVNNIMGFIFLLIPRIPHIAGTDSVWMNWAMVGSVGVCLPAILMIKERYYRLEVDEHEDRKISEQY